MTPEEKQIAIAEFDGQTCDNCGEILCDCAIVEIGSGVPDYFTFRDAICGAVGKLDGLRQRIFAYTLLAIVCKWPVQPTFRKDESLNCDEWTAEDAMKVALASPSQWAAALLITLGQKP